jgi:hypothetical protein
MGIFEKWRLFFYLGGEKIGRQKEKQQGQLCANAL